MATPLTPDQFVAALRAEGLDVRLAGNWRTHSRNHKGAWGPVHGIIQHHTVSRGSASSVELCRTGYEGLPGPLCHGVIDKEGVVHVISVGRANHAGGGDPNVLAAVTDERYNDYPPAPHVGNATGVDGNARFYGFECVNMGDGKDPWPAVQVDAMVRASAALSRAHGWTGKSTIAHKEWSRDKSDPKGPGMPGMPEFRAKIAERLKRPASWNPTAPTPPTTGTALTKPNRSLLRRTEDMNLIENTPQAIYWTTEYPDDANGHGDGGKTVGSNIVYDGIVNLRVTGLGEGHHLEIYAAEEDSNGVLLGESEIRHQVWGNFEGFHPLVMSIPVHGHVTNRLSFRVVSRASVPVVIEEAWLSLHSWPQS